MDPDSQQRCLELKLRQRALKLINILAVHSALRLPITYRRQTRSTCPAIVIPYHCLPTNVVTPLSCTMTVTISYLYCFPSEASKVIIFFLTRKWTWRDSSVSDYWPWARCQELIHGSLLDISPHYHIHTGSRPHFISYPIGTVVSCPGLEWAECGSSF